MPNFQVSATEGADVVGGLTYDTLGRIASTYNSLAVPSYDSPQWNINFTSSIAASLATTDGQDNLAASVGVLNAVAAAVVELADSYAFVGGPRIDGSSQISDGADVLSAGVVAQLDAQADLLDGADSLSASVVQTIGASASLVDGADGLQAAVDSGDGATSGGADYETKKRKKRYVVEVDGQLLVFNNQQSALRALDATSQPEPQVKAVKPALKPVSQVSLETVRELAAERQALEYFQQQLAQLQYEALLRKYEEWADEQDIEDLLATL